MRVVGGFDRSAVLTRDTAGIGCSADIDIVRAGVDGAVILSRNTADSAAAENSLVAASDDNSVVDCRDTAANIGRKFAVVIGSGDFFRHTLDRDLYGHGGGMIAVDAVGDHAVVDIGDTAHRVMLCVRIC